MKKNVSAEESSAFVEKPGRHYGSVIGQIVLIITFGLLGILVPRKDQSLAFVFCFLSLLAPLIRNILGLDDGPSCPFWSHADANSLPVCLVFNRLGRAHLRPG